MTGPRRSTAAIMLMQPLPSRHEFFRHVFRNLVLAGCILAVCLGGGMVGYHGLESLSWTDSLLNASMILSGMGPATELHTTAGKVFASFYALFSGIAFISIAGIVLAPVAHRLLHKFHLDMAEDVTDE